MSFSKFYFHNSGFPNRSVFIWLNLKPCTVFCWSLLDEIFTKNYNKYVFRHLIWNFLIAQRKLNADLKFHIQLDNSLKSFGGGKAGYAEIQSWTVGQER